ncbi:hypothetical protein J7E78_22315 [Paenibacillus polymyxa]|uniref:hypothetical protein n=1 Tax=Paenibacillus polymyxa TaxID=1406 RepID=UPI001BEC01FD|nr:hypothetical protein [Paenibacillus polymyxa]MBT2286275.1 hypothetical protein [Paenibacillus polymyxa]
MSEKETYEEILEFIREHREIEFVYENRQYAFLSHKEGFAFVCENKTQGPIFTTYEEMIKESKINGETFLELFKNNELTITAVF